MSQKAYEELEAIRRATLDRQTTCAWCGKICKHADHLSAHIMLRHPTPSPVSPVKYRRVVENVQITFEFLHIYDHDDNAMRPTPQDYNRAFIEAVKNGQWMARIGNPVLVNRREEER